MIPAQSSPNMYDLARSQPNSFLSASPESLIDFSFSEYKKAAILSRSRIGWLCNHSRDRADKRFLAEESRP